MVEMLGGCAAAQEEDESADGRRRRRMCLPRSAPEETGKRGRRRWRGGRDFAVVVNAGVDESRRERLGVDGADNGHRAIDSSDIERDRWFFQRLLFQMDFDELGAPVLNGRDGTWRGYLQMCHVKRVSLCKIAQIALCCASDADPTIRNARWQAHHHHQLRFL